MFRSLLGLLPCVGLLVPLAAEAHVIAGARVFPVTLTFDDPGMADEATLPQFVFQPGPSGQHQYNLEWEYDKTITPTFGLIYNQGWDILQQPETKLHTGLENIFISAKWQFYTNPITETVISAGIIREFAGNRATVNIGGDAYGSTAPTLYFGQGFGDLSIGLLRPLAITGEFSYIIADRRLNSAADNNGNPNSVAGGFSIQYSIPYLQSQVQDFGFPQWIAGMIPLVEFTWFSPAEAPANGLPATLMIAPGVIYMADGYQIGMEALVPGNRAAGPHVGAILQVHFFFDDLFPHTLGAPLFR
ncbi:MAG: hypothetical protein K6U10_01920 [Acidobacteriia bacterium]|nr:hypothetical protein [Methyloceanibacter sp.]MBX5471828.1 hypothetical protein [Acetobacteraceae bacterium]MCL6490557.1 hypothetical protein [Terriglobia bacterium]